MCPRVQRSRSASNESNEDFEIANTFRFVLFTTHGGMSLLLLGVRHRPGCIGSYCLPFY